MLTREQKGEIAEALRKNPSVKVIAKEFGVSKTTILSISKRNMIKTSGSPVVRLTLAHRARIIEALTLNSNATAVALQVGNVTPSGVQQIAKKVGIKLTDGKRLATASFLPPQALTDRVIQALIITPNAKEVTAQLGDVSYGVVYRISRRAGIELVNGREARRRNLRAAKPYNFSLK